jgi:hypothetical protein
MGARPGGVLEIVPRQDDSSLQASSQRAEDRPVDGSHRLLIEPAIEAAANVTNVLHPAYYSPRNTS